MPAGPEPSGRISQPLSGTCVISAQQEVHQQHREKQALNSSSMHDN